MGSNFNNNVNPVDKEKEDEEIEEVEEVEEDLPDEKEFKPTPSYSAKSRMLKYLAILIVVFFVIIFFVWFASLFNTKKYTYSEVEDILEQAAKDYFKDYPADLPKGNGDIVEIDYTNLVNAGKMKNLNEYTGGKKCTGAVQVENIDDDYSYTPFLNCGEDYTTMKLSEAITSQPLAGKGEYGLYKTKNGEYIFRGEQVNNYVEMDMGLWRIVRVTSGGNIVLVKDAEVGKAVPYDDRYNKINEWRSGINSFSASRIKDTLEDLYNINDKDSDDMFLSKKDKKKLATFDFCIGKRGSTDVSTDNSTECKEVQHNSKVGLLTVSDYMRASIDVDCTTPLSKTCSNYNYLKAKFDWWLATANSDSSDEAYTVTRSGYIKLETTSSYSDVRPVIYLNERAMIKEGKGTLKKPYVLK